jgi:hypothetical protein
MLAGDTVSVVIRTHLLLICCFLGSMTSAQERPKTMTKLEVQLQGPDIPADSFVAKPRVMYRAGSRYCRIEEAPDPDRGLHGLLILNEPDYWMTNLATKTARHGVDPGPTFNCHLPMFANDPDKEAAGLEFGLEMEFFKGKGAKPAEGPVLQGKKTTKYEVENGSSKLALFTYGDPERPLGVGRVRGDKGEVYWYSGYGQLPFDAMLFAKPEGMKVEEIKP